jgi:phosphorylcholine metabolism protein LicD
MIIGILRYPAFKLSYVIYMAGKEHTENQLNTILIAIIKLLHSYKATNWFIAYGTLLGIVRNNSCIDKDDDVDIIIDIQQKDLLKQIIKENNFKYMINANNFMKIELERGMPTVDFYLANVDNNGNFNDTWTKVVWSNVYDLHEKEWNNLILYMPNNYETKLENRYGDWKIPKKSKGLNPQKKII